MACGQGNLLHFLKKRDSNNISGVDVSPEQVALARQVVPTTYEANILEFLEAHAGEYDFIVGLDIVEHFSKDEVLRFMDGCRTALKPGGRLVLQTPSAESPWAAHLRYGDFTHEVSFQSNSTLGSYVYVGFATLSLVNKARCLVDTAWSPVRVGFFGNAYARDSKCTILQRSAAPAVAYFRGFFSVGYPRLTMCSECSLDSLNMIRTCVNSAKR